MSQANWRIFTQFMPLISFDTPWKHKKASGFLMFSGRIKRDIGMKWVNCLMPAYLEYFDYMYILCSEKKDSIAGFILRILANFSKHLQYNTSANNCSCHSMFCKCLKSKIQLSSPENFNYLDKSSCNSFQMINISISFMLYAMVLLLLKRQ